MDFEVNRRNVLADLRDAELRKKASSCRNASRLNAAETVEAEKKTSYPPVVVFGNESLFVNNLVSTLKNTGFTIKQFSDDIDKTADYLPENGIHHVLIDIDLPSDYHQAVNLLVVVKSLIADACLIIYIKDVEDSRTRSLNDHGGVVLEKPFSLQDLYKYRA
jgi:two-component SAPR family response regulator